MPIGLGTIISGLSGVGSLVGGLLGSNAAQTASAQQIAAEQQAAQIAQQYGTTAIGGLQPYAAAGGNALAAYQQALGLGGPTGASGGLNPTAFQGSPGYQWQMDQGLGAISNQASAQGGVQSGNTLKALTQYGQGLANQDWTQYLNQLLGLSGAGQSAASQQGQFGITTAQTVGNAYVGAGNAAASGTVGSANAWSSGISGAGNNALLGYYLNGMNGGNGGGAAATTTYGGYLPWTQPTNPYGQMPSGVST